MTGYTLSRHGSSANLALLASVRVQNIGNTIAPVLQQCIQRLTQRTVKFIRWLKNHLDSKRSWQHSLARLVKIYARS